MSEPNIYDDNYKLVYNFGPYNPENVNATEDAKIYNVEPRTNNPVVFMGSTITEAHFLAFKYAVDNNKEVIFLAGGPVTPPPYPPTNG